MCAKKVNLVTLGCSKNKVDAEFLGAKLVNVGYEVMHESEQASDVVIVNTCGFIGDAKEESVDTILSYARLRKKGKISKLIVMGCLAQRYQKELEAELHEVDAFYGVNALSEITEMLSKEIVHPDDIVLCNSTRLLSNAPHFAYLKISEGCDRSCSFCAIPLIRGGHVSRSIESLVEETKMLSAQGAKEIVLIAQELTYYGIDIYKKRALAELLRELVKVDGIEWIRLQYAYPHGFPEEVMEVVANEHKICKYIDLPLQHISSRILASMKRNIDKEETIRTMNLIREKIPGVAFRTTFIVGFPGETEEEFGELYDFVKNSRFERMGVFAYSPEEGTAADALLDDVPDEVKAARIEKLMELQQNISHEINLDRVGSIYKVMVDRIEGDYYVGRTEFDSPEVDNEVLIIKEDIQIQIGNFFWVKITEADPFDLYGQIVETSATS